MPDLNLREVDAELIRKLKTDAARNGMTLRQYCIDLLSGRFPTMDAMIVKRDLAMPYHQVKSTDYPGLERSKGCKKCGSIGTHQKWCGRGEV
jgi:hypothetical protein